MSSWTYITGVIQVSPLGRTQAEKTYILETTLQHLPKVTGSEEDMYVHYIKRGGINHSCSHNEFGEWNSDGCIEMQDNYILVVEGNFRDRFFNQTYREFIKWLTRLAKRIIVDSVLVTVQDDFGKRVIITDKDNNFNNLFEIPSWCADNKHGEPAWCEYLMWESLERSDYPAVLAYKYYEDDKNDKRVESWLCNKKRINKQ